MQAVLPEVTDKLIILKSVFEGRPSTVFFPYPSFINIKQDSDRLYASSGEENANLFMSVASQSVNCPEFEETIRDAGLKVT